MSHRPQTLSAPQTSPSSSTLRQSCTFSFYPHIVNVVFNSFFFFFKSHIIVLEHRNGGNMQSKAPKTSTWSAWSPPRLSKGHGTRWPLKKQKWLSCQCKWLSQDREKIQTFDQQKCVCFDVLLAVLIMIYESGFRDNMYLCLFLCV